MTEQHVSVFVSHKVDYHKDAAKRIKEILQSRAERLDVYICEDTAAGVKWRDLIKEKLTDANVLLMLLPPNGADIEWIKSEIETFEKAHPTGWIIPFKDEADEVPGFMKKRQVIDISVSNIYQFLLQPLFNGDPTTTGLQFPLNPRVSEIDLKFDAKQIEEVLLGFAPKKSKPYGEYFIVEVCGVDTGVSIDNAVVEAPDGCSNILNWQKKEFLWKELVEWANKEKGKGTFWVTEMADVVKNVCEGEWPPPVMTSTFRGRGGESAGLIFQPQLYNVDYVSEKPVRLYFSFHKVLTPELVRGTGEIGDVFDALYTATRMRWEVIEPFYVKKISQLPIEADEQKQLIAKAINSFRIIDEFSERYQVISDLYHAFEVSKNQKLTKLAEFIKSREDLKENLYKAAQTDNFTKFMDQLSKGLLLNLEVTEMLAEEYLQLVREDHKKIKSFLNSKGSVKNPSNELGDSDVTEFVKVRKLTKKRCKA